MLTTANSNTFAAYFGTNDLHDLEVSIHARLISSPKGGIDRFIGLLSNGEFHKRNHHPRKSSLFDLNALDLSAFVW